MFRRSRSTHANSKWHAHLELHTPMLQNKMVGVYGFRLLTATTEPFLFDLCWIDTQRFKMKKWLVYTPKSALEATKSYTPSKFQKKRCSGITNTDITDQGVIWLGIHRSKYSPEVGVYLICCKMRVLRIHQPGGAQNHYICSSKITLAIWIDTQRSKHVYTNHGRVCDLRVHFQKLKP